MDARAPQKTAPPISAEDPADSTDSHDSHDSGRANGRRAIRRRFSSIQMVAPYDGTALPEDDMFFQVLCHDISTRGFAYFSATRPMYDHLIVRLTDTQGCTHELKARVAHWREGYWEKKRQLLIGCEFQERVSAERRDWSVERGA